MSPHRTDLPRPFRARTTAAWLQGLGSLLIPAAAAAAPLEVTVSGPDGAPLADAVVSVSVRGGAATSAPGTTAQIGQRGKRFEPSVLVIQTGTAVNFPNFDTVRHHVYSFSPIKPFELKLYAATPAAPVVFDKPGNAALGCNIHDAMSAFVRVVDTPYFAKTDAQGKAVIDVPAGSHTLKVWHPSMPIDAEPAAQAVSVAAGGSALAVKAGN